MGTTDYLNVTGRLNFTDGHRSGIITVPVTEDSGYEGLEAFRLQLREAGSGAVLAAPQARPWFTSPTPKALPCAIRTTPNTRDTCI
jgi:hypothetical protein